MTMQLCIRNSSYTATYEYHGEHPELWQQSIKRVGTNSKFVQEKVTLKGSVYREANVILPEWQAELSRRGIRAVKNRIRLPLFYVEVERVLDLIAKGDWVTLRTEFDREYFKDGIRFLWRTAKECGYLVLERLVYECLSEMGNGGLTVDDLLLRLWHHDIHASFHEIRDALEHLCILFVVERNGELFSIRNGFLEGKA